LSAERDRFEAQRSVERAELDRAWQALYDARDRDAAALAEQREAVAAEAAAQRSWHAHGEGLYTPPEPGAFAWESPVYAPPAWAGVKPETVAPTHAEPAELYAVGGLAKGSEPLASCERLQPGAPSWRPLPPLLGPRGYCAALLLPAHLAHAAGRPPASALLALGGSAGGAPLGSCEVLSLDPHDSTGWQGIAGLAQPRVWHAAALLRGAMPVVLGGHTGAGVSPSCEALDLETDAPRGLWRPLAPLGRPRAYLAAAALRGSLYAVGGFAAPNYLALVEAYDPSGDAWHAVAPLRHARRGHGCAALEGMGLLVVGGGYDGERSLAEVEGWDPRANTWHPLAPLRRPRQLLGLAAAGGCAYAVGGFDGGAGGRWVECYDAAADAWRDLPPLGGSPRFGLGLAAGLV